MNGLREKLQQDLLDEEYRYAYDEEFANSLIATQLKVIREQRELTQAQLAAAAEMKQSRISTMENVNYSMWSISTLRRLARALGVRLAFRFESWGALLSEVESFSRQSLAQPKFEEDPLFKPQPAIKQATKDAADVHNFVGFSKNVSPREKGISLMPISGGTSSADTQVTMELRQ